ncbi:MAG: hypothetical protein ABI629_01360 [bacterium]
MSRPRVWVWRGAAPLWLALATLPLALLFLFSLAAAGALLIGGALLASWLLPRAKRRQMQADGTIELDRADYKRLK